MKRCFILSIVLLSVFILQTVSFAGEGNVWLVDEKGSKHFTCPVMGNEAVVDEDTKYSEYKGDRYYFCCPGCKPAFEKDPEKYLKKMTLPGNMVKVEDKNKYFTCPITGEMGQIKKDTPYSDHNGMRYYLCCEGCKPKFEANPQKYINSVEKKTGKQYEGCLDCDKTGCTSGVN